MTDAEILVWAENALSGLPHTEQDEKALGARLTKLLATAVLAESEWWNARTVATSVRNADLDARVAANRAKVGQ